MKDDCAYEPTIGLIAVKTSQDPCLYGLLLSKKKHVCIKEKQNNQKESPLISRHCG